MIGDFYEIVDRLRRGKRFALVTHVAPDGDTIGSALALHRALGRILKDSVVVGDDPVPALYRFLPGADGIVRPEAVSGDLDALIYIDCADLARAGTAARLAERARVTINIDHHATNEAFGQLNYLDPRAAATGELVYQVVKALEVPFDRELATALYTAIVTDTGSFQYENTGVDSHLIAAELMVYEVEPWVIAQRLFETRSEGNLRLLCEVLGTLRLHAGGRIGTVQVSQAMLERTGATEDDVEGLVNYPRSIESVAVAARLLETRSGEIRVSLRARDQADVSQIAAEFGGGGHERAAGCNLPGPIEEAERRLVAAAARWLERHLDGTRVQG